MLLITAVLVIIHIALPIHVGMHVFQVFKSVTYIDKSSHINYVICELKKPMLSNTPLSQPQVTHMAM